MVATIGVDTAEMIEGYTDPAAAAAAAAEREGLRKGDVSWLLAATYRLLRCEPRGE